MNEMQKVHVCYTVVAKETYIKSIEWLYICSLFFLFPALRQNKPFFNPADTNALVGAVAFGKGLSKCRPPGPVAQGHPGQGPMMSGGPTLQQVTIGSGSSQQAGIGGPVAPQQQGQPGRRPDDWVY